METNLNNLEMDIVSMSARNEAKYKAARTGNPGDQTYTARGALRIESYVVLNDDEYLADLICGDGNAYVSSIDRDDKQVIIKARGPQGKDFEKNIFQLVLDVENMKDFPRINIKADFEGTYTANIPKDKIISNISWRNTDINKK